MLKTNQASITVLAVVVVALIVGIVASLTLDGGEHMNARSNDYMGMMDAMGRMDSDEMLGRMRTILGTEQYQAMLAHMEDHRTGTAMTAGSGVDGMMHMMMDGMMGQMPDDENNQMPMMPR